MTSLVDFTYYATTEDALAGTPRTFSLNGAVRTALPGRPMVAREGEVIPRLRATLHRRTKPWETVATLDGAYGRQWQDELNEVGSAAMTMGNENPDSLLPNEGDIIRFEDQGYACFSWIVREINRQQIAEGEEVDQTTEFTGEGLLSLLREAVVYPANDIGAQSIRPIEETRYFSWQSNAYNDDHWRTAQIVSYYDPGQLQTPLGEPPQSGMFGGVTEWPMPGVPVITTNMGDYWLAPGGWCYFRKLFWFGPEETARTLIVYGTADDASMWWFDSIPMFTTYEWTNTNDDLIYFTVDVTPGWHVISVAVENSTAPPMWSDLFERYINSFLVMCAVYRYDDNTGEPYGEPFVWTDDTWKIVDYPPHPPGWTPGQVLHRAFFEAGWARHSLPGIQLAFTEEADSDGNPWPEVGDINTKVGTDYFTFIAKEMTETYIDVWMGPDLRLYAWIKGRRGENKPDVVLEGPTDPTDPWSGNLAALSYKRVD